MFWEILHNKLGAYSVYFIHFWTTVAWRKAGGWGCSSRDHANRQRDWQGLNEVHRLLHLEWTKFMQDYNLGVAWLECNLTECRTWVSVWKTSWTGGVSSAPLQQRRPYTCLGWTANSSSSGFCAPLSSCEIKYEVLNSAWGFSMKKTLIYHWDNIERWSQTVFRSVQWNQEKQWT